MVVLGFTVTFVRRRQVPNTYCVCTALRFTVSTLDHVDVCPRPATRRRVESFLACVPT
jgi:hypothetical protein